MALKNIIRKAQMIYKKNKQNKGVALVSVLAILTVLAILAAAFTVQMRMESTTANTLALRNKSDMLMLAATEHAKAQIYNDSITMPGIDSTLEPWNSNFSTSSKDPKKSINIKNISKKSRSLLEKNSKWIYVRDDAGTIIGRYAVSIEDEAGKINVNTACSISSKTQNQGIETSEILLSNGKTRGLPINFNSIKKIFQFRYGRDKAPGQANIDDNINNISLMYDGIDNNGNGIIDETDEGIDEPIEYNSVKPIWDDRSFSSVNDVAAICGIKNGRGKSALRKYCTVYSKSRDKFWDDEQNKMQLPVNINVSTTRQIHKVLKRGNSQKTFEGSSKNLKVLSASITDYRDENHVLSTIGGEYGIESICFNEIMANNGNFTLESDYEGWAPRLGFWYNGFSETRSSNNGDDSKNYNYRTAWRIKSVVKQGGSKDAVLFGEKLRKLPYAKMKLNEPTQWDSQGGTKSLFKRLTNDEWMPDVFKNATLILIKDKAGKDRLYYPIAGNDNHSLEVCYDNTKDFTLAELEGRSDDARIMIDTLWWPEAASYCVFPRQTDVWWVPTQFDKKIKRPDHLYYYLYLAEQSFDRDIGQNYLHYPLNSSKAPKRPYKGYNPYLDVDGEPRRDSKTKMTSISAKELKGTTLEMPAGRKELDLLRTPYKDKKPVRAKNGYIRVCVTSGKNTGYVDGIDEDSSKGRIPFENKNTIDAMYVMRPDIIELINISDKPISLNNWQVIVNTGSSVDRVGWFKNVTHYSKDFNGRYDDPNPTIPPQGYFYLTNNKIYFDEIYGSAKSGVWGDSKKEAYCCYELPESLWGVRYKITSINVDKVKVKGAKWKTDQMKGEIIEFQAARYPKNSNGITGIRRGVVGNTRSTLKLNVDAHGTGVRVGDDILIVGLPGAGGFLSMTLKNEYNQIASRIVQYGSLDTDEIEYSTQKIDPTRYEWQVSKHPTFGGTKIKAKNNNVKGEVFIKNGRFSSMTEIQSVKTAKSRKSVGSEQAKYQIFKAIGKYFTTSGIRLDPEEKDVHISGWKPAFGTAVSGQSKAVKTKNASWTADIWNGQKLRVLSGEQRGETFLINGNSENSVSTDGYSIPSGKSLKVSAGDRFSLGPGYSTPMFYTRREAEEGIWEWENRNLDKTFYALYISGLNDSIDTTEFFEENNNAQIEVQVFNFITLQYDKMPTDYGTKAFDKLYGRPGSSVGRFQYGKSDLAFCGFIGPENISSKNGIKVKLIAHGLNNQKCSGFAWFDYIYLAPGASAGKININTALPRVLACLKGINKKLAENIYKGADSSDKPILKPYKCLTDLLDVKGMNTEIYGSICNLITVRSDQFRVNIIAQTLKDISTSKKSNPDYEVTTVSRKSIILDRQNLTSISSNQNRIDIILDE